MVLTIAAVVALAGCGGSAAEPEGTAVVAGFYPLAFAAERVAGGDTSVRNLTPAGAEPHDLELSARDVAAVAGADLVLYAGGFQPALEEALATHEVPALDVLAGLALQPAAPHAHDDEDEHAGENAHDDPEEDAHEDADARDPHVWLDPLLYAQVVERVGVRLGREAVARDLARELRALHEEFAAGLRRCERRELVTSHAAFGYLARRYDLEQVALAGVSPEAEPTPRQLERLVEEVRAHGATTVFFETLVSPRLADTVARAVGARTAVLNPLEGLTRAEEEAGRDYFSVMRANLAALREALSCR
jgi:zinc transport system substrate-binding protein